MCMGKLSLMDNKKMKKITIILMTIGMVACGTKGTDSAKKQPESVSPRSKK